MHIYISKGGNIHMKSNPKNKSPLIWKSWNLVLVPMKMEAFHNKFNLKRHHVEMEVGSFDLLKWCPIHWQTKMGFDEIKKFIIGHCENYLICDSFLHQIYWSTIVWHFFNVSAQIWHITPQPIPSSLYSLIGVHDYWVLIYKIVCPRYC